MLKAKFEIPDEELNKIDELHSDMVAQFKQLTEKEVAVVG